MSIVNELSPLASVNNNLIAQSIKELIGPRVIDMFESWKSDSTNAGRKKRLKGFGSFLGNATRDVVMSNFSQIVMGSAMNLYTMDWNKTDKQIEEELKANEATMYGAAGRLVGQGSVRMLGFGVTKKARQLYPQIDPTTLIDIDEEGTDEIKSAIKSMITGMRTAMQKQAMLTTYMSGRKLFGYKEDLDKDGKVIPKQPWILSDKLDDFAEKSQDKNLKAFMTNLKDEAEDAVFDLGYMITNGVTMHYQMTQAALAANKKTAKLVKYTPDKTEPRDYTFIQGDEENIKTAINGARLNQVSMQSKDVGSIAMIGLGRAMKADLSERSLTCYYYDGINGASNKAEGRATVKTFRISNIKRTVDWALMKELLKPVMGGPIKVTCKLSDGHELQGYFSTEAEGKAFFTPIAQRMCIGNIVSFQPAAINSDIRKRPEVARFEVSRCTLFVQDDTADEKQGRYVARDGKLKRTKQIKIKMNSPKGKPEGIDRLIAVPFGVTF